MMASYSKYSPAAGVLVAQTPSRTVTGEPLVLQIDTLNVAVFAEGTVYSVVFVTALGEDCPNVPVAMIAP
jgi:hypothetical protein